MSRTIEHTRSWKTLFAALALLAFCLAGQNAMAQALTSFTISTTPSGTPVQGGSDLVITPLLTGSTTAGPSGSVDVFTSSTSACSSVSTDLGTQALTVNNPVSPSADFTSTATFYDYSGPYGTYYVCATYIPGAPTPFTTATTAAGAQATFYAATSLSALQQSFPVAGQPVTISLALSTPAGQPAPTGTITITDPGDTVVGTATASASGISPSSLTVTLPDGTYTAIYSGDANYAGQQQDGTAYYSNALVSISPAAIPSGSAQTTLTVNGNGFISGSTVQITNPAGVPTTLATTYVSANKLTAVVPAANLATAQTSTIQVITSGSTSNSVNLDIDALQASTAVATATPSRFVYGQTSTAILGATISPPASGAAGTPTGSVNFTLTGPGASPTQLALGSGTLSAASGNGSYNPGAIASAIDLPPTRAVTVDLNRDGFADVVALPSINSQSGADFPPPYLQIFLSTGVNSFASEQTVPTDCPATDFAVGDINGDGIPDLVALCPADTGGPVATYMLGNGDGTFQAPVAFLASTTLTNPTNIVIGDFNGDGKMDVALVDGYNAQLQVFSGNATFGTFTADAPMSFPNTGTGIMPPAVADFNQDGKSDIAILTVPEDTGSGTLILLTSVGDGTFTTQSQTITTPSFALGAPAITDVNGDGYPDIAVADPGNDSSPDTGQILVYVNNGSGTLNAPLTYAVTGPQSVTGTPFPVVGKPSTTFTQPWSIFYNTVNFSAETVSVGGLAVAGGAITSVYSAQSDGYDLSSYGTPDLIFAGDFNGSGHDDIGTFVAPTDTGPPAELLPFFYTNSSTASLTGVAAVPNAGIYSLAANYLGNNTFAASISPAIPITIDQAAPGGATLQVPTTAAYGQSVTFTVTMTGVPGGTIPSGTVDFSVDGQDVSGPVSLVPGASSSTAQFTTSNLSASAAAHQISAVYSGDTNYTTSNLGPSPITVAAAGFTLALSSSATTVTAGTFVTFTAQAAGSAALPTGEPVTISGLPTAAATPVLNSAGQAIYRFGMLPPGTYTVQANYSSDGNFQSATSNGLTLTVNPAPVTVTVTSSANPVTSPTPVNLTATVNSLGLGIPTGTVAFANGGTSLGSGTLAIVNGTSGMNPTGTFDPTTGSNVLSEAVGDFNHDGKPDLAVLESNGSGVNLLVSLGNGDGTFQAPTTYALTDPGVDALVAADFNGDGYTDLAIASSVGYVYIYTASGDASGDIALTQTFDLDSGGTGIAAGDFNKDGLTDLAILGTSGVSVYLNTGAGVFATTPAYVNSSPYSQYSGIAVADFNKDGYPDIAVSGGSIDGGSPGGWDVEVFTNNAVSTLGFTEATYTVNGNSTGVAAGDFNGDGYPDLAVLSGGDSTVDVLINQNGTFPTDVSYATVAEPDAITTADFNKDGFDDIAITGVAGGTGGGSGILFGSSTGAMTTAMSLPTTNGTAIATADLNSDGNPDLLIGYQSVAAFVDSSTQTTISNVVLPPGTDPVTGTFTPTGAYFADSTSPAFNELVNPNAPVLNWVTPAPIYYGTPLSSTQLDATASVPGTFTYTPAAGSVLGLGPQTLSVLFTPTDTVDYSTATDTVTITVQPGSILTSILPSTGNLGNPATTITLTGIGFTAQSVAELNGTPLATTYVSPTSLQAIIPASVFTSVQSEPISVLTPGEPSSSAVQFSVIAAQAQATVTAPPTADPGTQPTVDLQLSQSYPVPITATLTLTVQPQTSGGLTDPAVQFATGGLTSTITIPANSTTAIPIQLQSGTLAGSITVTTTLSADGSDVTPPTLQPVVIQVPTSPPTITSVSIARSGQTVTVTVQGYSNTRAVQSADFHFTAASGAQISNPDVTVQLTDAFGGWYALTNSDQYGSAFSYVQTFTLSEDASSVGSVSVTLSNSLGSSNPESAQ